jgi:nucleoside-diphosphate-sugar epimerase
LCARLSAGGDRVEAWDLPSVDMLDAAAVCAAIDGARPSVVFHLAATGLTHDRSHDPSVIDENVRMTANLIEACESPTVVVHVGSMSEYGSAGTLSESDPCAPTTAYGIAKLAATHYALAYGPNRGLRVRVARLFGVYGAGEQAHRLFPMLLKNLRAGTPVPLSDGLQRRDFIHVDDVCEGLVRLAALGGHAGGLVVNLGTGVALRVRDVARWIAAAVDADESLLRFGARERSPGDTDLIVADVARLRETLGWVPRQRLGAGMDIVGLFGAGQDDGA